MNDLKHIAIIPDGNRRFAREHNLPTFEGHRLGFNNVKTIGLHALKLGVEYFSLWGFSTENWKRSKEEVDYLMELLALALTKELNFYLKESVRLRVIGRRDELSQKLQNAIDTAQEKTSGGKRGQFNLFINYGGHEEIVDGVKKLLVSGVSHEQINEQKISSVLWTHELPDPDLIIRTSGEQRLSGFMSWSGAYSEIMFENMYWPEFTTASLERCIKAFHKRNRRFGE